MGVEVDRRDSQCVDRDWWAYREALQRNGVLIRFLCGRRFHLRLDSLIGQRFKKTAFWFAFLRQTLLVLGSIFE